LTPSSRARGTGTASRYRRLPQLASLATVSPAKSANTTTSRNPADTRSVNSAKFSPLEVARLTSAEKLPSPSLSPSLSWNAARMINGSATMNPSASCVRRREAWRRVSVQTVRVRPAR
jgi:hypothetical protein